MDSRVFRLIYQNMRILVNKDEIMTSRERVQTLLSGKLPDRPPLYDVIRNDKIIEHFGNAILKPETAERTVIDAHVTALDATKASFRLPAFEAGKTVTGPNGRKVVIDRWTSWIEHESYDSTEEYVEQKTESTAGPWDWTEEDENILHGHKERWLELEGMSGDIVRDFGLPGPPRLDNMFSDLGLEAFSYYMADCPDIIHRQIEHHFVKVLQALEHLEIPPTLEVIEEACDMAFKTNLLFSPSFLRKSFLPAYSRLCDAVHKAGRKVLFHSDGDLTNILDDLVENGIDLLHPVEPLAGMDPGVIHKRYPDLILCGTIDVSQLLPFGTPQQIADQVKRNIEATEGKIMVGSSTEINNEVPLENYLALHKTVLDYAY